MIRVVTRPTLSAGPDLTALIDIVFIVVVFLLLTANSPLLSLPVDIPNTDSQIENVVKTKQNIIISLKANAPKWQLTVAGKGSDDLGEKKSLKEQYNDWPSFKSALLFHLEQSSKSLLIATESDTNAELLIQLLALINERGLSDAQILMEPEI
ncbi:MAG: biopolymer transport protein ExbD [Oleiphilaceae bacterium]|jgi:biopolymer transport protein ExbD